jgi:hypothetical protein
MARLGTSEPGEFIVSCRRVRVERLEEEGRVMTIDGLLEV